MDWQATKKKKSKVKHLITVYYIAYDLQLCGPKIVKHNPCTILQLNAPFTSLLKF
jgi:hypothetical protein